MDAAPYDTSEAKPLKFVASATRLMLGCADGDADRLKSGTPPAHCRQSMVDRLTARLMVPPSWDVLYHRKDPVCCVKLVAMRLMSIRSSAVRNRTQ